MLSRTQIQFITALHHKKYREEYGCFIAEGTKIVEELMYSDFTIRGVYAEAGWIVSHLKETGSQKIPVTETLPHEMKRISALNTPGPVLAVVNIPGHDQPDHQISVGQTSGSALPDHPYEPVSGHSELLTSGFPVSPRTPSPAHPLTGSSSYPFTVSPSQCLTIPWSPQWLTLALDDIRDPGNLGTIIRIADWFGIHTILCSFNCVDQYNPKVVQATMGSIARVRIIRCDLEHILALVTSQPATSDPGNSATGSQVDPVPAIPVYGAFTDGENVYRCDLTRNGILLIGNESHGISTSLLPLITRKVAIPAFQPGDRRTAESLNASVATALLVAEFFRRLEYNAP